MGFVKTTEKFLTELTLLNETDGTSEDLRKYFKAISIQESFFSKSFPLVVLELTVTEKIKDIIRDNECSFYFRAFKYNYNSSLNQENEIDENEIATTEVSFETDLRLFTKPLFSSATENVNTTDTVSSEEPGRQISVPMFNCQLTTIPSKEISINDIVVNQVFVKTRPGDAIINLLMENIETDLFMEYPDNMASSEEILVPPLNLVPAVKYIQNVYGVYNHGLNLFFSFGKTYLFSPLKEKDSPENTFTILIEPTSENNDSEKYSAVYVDEMNNVNMYLKVSPTLSSIKKITENQLGNTAVFNSYDEDFNLVTRIEDNQIENCNKTRYFWNSYQNKFFENSFINSLRKSNKTTSITLMNVDPNYFTPSTKVKIIGQNSGFINGEYAITEKSYRLSSTDKKHYTPSIRLSLLKIDE